MRARPLVLALVLLGAACGDDGGSSPQPQLSEAEQVERYCTYFKAHRTESKQQLIGGLIEVAPDAIEADLRASHGMNEPGYESTKRVQAYTQDKCEDPVPELSTP